MPPPAALRTAALALGAIAIAAFAHRAVGQQRGGLGPDCARIAAVLRSSPANDLP